MNDPAKPKGPTWFQLSQLFMKLIGFPLIIVAGYKLYGLVGFCICVLLKGLWHYAMVRLKTFKPSDAPYWASIPGLGLMVLSLYQNEWLFVQLTVTVSMVLLLLRQVWIYRVERPSWIPIGKVNYDHPNKSMSAWLIVTSLSILMIALNEWIRASFSVEVWVWFYAFCHLGLISFCFVSLIIGAILFRGSLEKWARSSYGAADDPR